MNAEKVLSSINLIAEKYGSVILAMTPEFMALAQSLREEIALAEQKKTGKGSRFKAALRFSKKVQKEFAARRPSMAGAYVDRKGAQCIIHEYYAVRFNEPMDGLVMVKESETPPDFEQLFASYDSSRSVALPSLAELKTKLKLDKAEGNLRDGRSISVLQGVHFNTDYLIQMVEMVEPSEAYFSHNGKHPNLIMFGDGACGLVCPMNLD